MGRRIARFFCKENVINFSLACNFRTIFKNSGDPAKNSQNPEKTKITVQQQSKISLHPKDSQKNFPYVVDIIESPCLSRFLFFAVLRCYDEKSLHFNGFNDYNVFKFLFCDE